MYQKHLSPENRDIIETALNSNQSIKDISVLLSKDPSTISKEIKRNRSYKEASKFGGYSNICVNRYNCTETAVCGDKSCLKECFTCYKCNTCCKLFKAEICKTLSRAPYVCNGCSKKTSCRLEKYYYRAKEAQTKYKTLLSSSRAGINMSEDELGALNELTAPLIRKGQPIGHIFASHNDEIPCTKRTFYSYVEKGIFSFGNIDLRRKVRYKKRKIKKISNIRRNSKLLIGRKYTDFINFTTENPDIKIVEMDTVEGVKGGKVILTIFFRESKLMLMILLNAKTQEAVKQVFDNIENSIGTELFKKTFPAILTDNGSEFLDPEKLENSSCKDNFKRTSIFYCDPNCSFQKGGIEKNHEYIRYIVPKGKSFNNFTQAHVELIMNHINSTSRENLNNHTPMEIARLLFPLELINLFNLKTISANNVCLTPKLISGIDMD